MSRLTIHIPNTPPAGESKVGEQTVDGASAQHTPLSSVRPLLVDIDGLALLLARSVPSLHRDDAAGRLPAAVRIGGSKRWRYADIVAWVELGCPSRVEFEARQQHRR
jgi:predicted DNA-binding transcriptional regulator AlpA